MSTNFRRVKIAKIHVAQTQLGMDNDTYHLMLQRITGKASCSKMNDAQLNQVLEEMKRLGFVPQKRVDPVAPPKPKADIDAMCRKINALLLDSGRTWDYAHAMAKHMFDRERVQWLEPRQIHKLVAALQVDANRRKKQ